MPTLPVFAYRCLSIEVEAGGRLYSGTLDSAPTLGRSPVKSCRTMTVVSVVLLSHFCSEGAYTNRPRSGPNTQSSSATVDVPDDVAGEAGGRGVITATACGTPPRVQSKRECVLGVHEEAAPRRDSQLRCIWARVAWTAVVDSAAYGARVASFP